MNERKRGLTGRVGLADEQREGHCRNSKGASIRNGG